MEIADLILVSVDDHLIEPPDMFDEHIAPRFKDRAPTVKRGTNGAHHWQIEGQRAPGLGLNAVAGRPKEEYGFEPVSYEQVRKGCFDPDARIEDMNANGVLGSICFGSFPGFAGARFQKMQDKELALATIQAYNDWHFNGWCGKHPGRFIPLAMLPLWDVGLAVSELERMVRLGCHAVTFPENPALIGLPSLHNECWERLWGACEEHAVVVCCHIGSAGNAPYPSDESPIDAWITSMPISIANAAADWLFARFWKRYPGLKMDEDSPAVRLARELTGANQVEAVAYGTEAGHFQAYGIPAVICGPGSIDQAHRPDEFCALSELEACEAFLRKVIAKACT